MLPFWRVLLGTILGLPVLVLALHTIIRIVRAFYKFPMPEFMANMIDNPLRRRMQPPEATPARHGIKPGMRVLEVGPGNGTYTLATARHLGKTGSLMTVDIEPKMIKRVQRRAQAEGIENIQARVASVHDLPFDDGTFDAIYMIAVIGEIPQPQRAMREFHRVLSPAGTLAFSELLHDPDYPRASTLVKLASQAGFLPLRRVGNLLHYTLLFEKSG